VTKLFSNVVEVNRQQDQCALIGFCGMRKFENV